MKKVFVLALFTFTAILSAQDVIVEEKYKKDDIPVRHNFIDKENTVIIQKGRPASMSKNIRVNKLIKYKSDGSNEVLIDNIDVMWPLVSRDGKVISMYNFNGVRLKTDKYNILYNGKFSKDIDMNEFYYSFSSNNKQYFVYPRAFNFSSNIEKDDVYLKSRNLDNFVFTEKKLEKPNLERLRPSNSIKFDENRLPCRVFENDNGFELITTSIVDEHKSMVIYKNFYDSDGNKGDEVSFELSLKENYFINTPNIKNSEETKDVYFYGLIGDKGKNIQSAYHKPIGFYIFKFSKDGKKIWESINYVNDKELNQKWNTFFIEEYLYFRNDELFFHFGPRLDNPNHFLHFAKIDINNGKLISIKRYDYKTNKIHITPVSDPTFSNFLTTFLSDKKILKNKSLDYEGYLYYFENIKFKNYIDSVNSKNKIMFQTLTAEQKDGFWLLETDNKTYYKVLYFKF
jgi:hypothetical protein